MTELDDLSELFSYLLGSRQSAIHDARSVRLHQEFEDVRNMTSSFIDSCLQKYTYTCEQVLQQLPLVSRSEDKESLLRCFKDRIAYFLTIVPAITDDAATHASSDADDLRKLNCEVVDLLATACEELGYFAEAFQLRNHVRTLRAQYGLRDNDGANDQEADKARCFVQKSSRMSNTFRSLRVPSRYVRLLPAAENFFPPAHLAVQAGLHTVARDMVGKDVYPEDACDILKRKAVHIAAETGDLVLLQLALGRNPSATSSRDIFRMTALCIAAYTGNAEMVTYLVEAGDDASTNDITGRSVLCMAAGGGHWAIVQYLLECGYRPNDVHQLGKRGPYSALHAAAAAGHAEIVDLLLEFGASALCQSQDLTPAQEAREHGHINLANRLEQIEQAQGDSLAEQVSTLSIQVLVDTPRNVPNLTVARSTLPNKYSSLASQTTLCPL